LPNLSSGKKQGSEKPSPNQLSVYLKISLNKKAKEQMKKIVGVMVATVAVHQDRFDVPVTVQKVMLILVFPVFKNVGVCAN